MELGQLKSCDVTLSFVRSALCAAGRKSAAREVKAEVAR
jgi:hypothetical protein